MSGFLADENVAPEVITALVKRGFDIIAVRDESPGAPDTAIVEWAIKEQRIILTHDGDFADLRRFPPQEHSGVIFLRLRNQHPPAVLSQLLGLLEAYPEEQLRGRLVIFQEGWIRFLPPM